MKINKALIIMLILIALIILVAVYMIKPVEQDHLSIPSVILNDYNISFSKISQLPGGCRIRIIGFVAKNQNSNIIPKSYLAIYRIVGYGQLLYRFSPVVPPEVDYPRPLMFEKADIVRQKDQFYIVTTWGETGADYFGTHPVVIAFRDGGFGTIPFYKGDLSDDPKISRLSWTRKDFTVTNCFNRKDSVLTILTQGVSVKRGGKITLRFFGDEKPHAARHKYIKFTFSL